MGGKGLPSVACTACDLPLRWAVQPPAGGDWQGVGGHRRSAPPRGSRGRPGAAEGRRVLSCHAPGAVVEATGPAAGPGERHPPAPAVMV